ncbi:hypothetical protein D3C87_1719700 [compost metagenome]
MRLWEVIFCHTSICSRQAALFLSLRQFQYGAEPLVVYDGTLVNDGQFVEDLIGQRPVAVFETQCTVRVVINHDFLVRYPRVFLCWFNQIKHLIVLECQRF